MTLVTKATRGAVAGNAWTNAANALTDNSVYATAAPAKNGTVSGDWDFDAFTDVEVPIGSTINSVTIRAQYKVSTTASIATLQNHCVNGGTDVNSSNDTAEPLADTNFDVAFTTVPTEADLKTAGNIVARVVAQRGNNNTAVTFSLDYIEVQVDYTAPSLADAATEVLTLTPFAAQESIIHSDAETEVLALVPSGPDVYTPGGVAYTDSATELLALIPSGTDVYVPAVRTTVGTVIDSVSSTSIVIPVNVAVPTGRTVVIAFGHSGNFGAAAPSVTDTRGNTWNVRIYRDNGTNTGTYVGIADSEITTALQVGDTITVSLNITPGNKMAAAYAYTNIDPASALDVSTHASGTSLSPSSGAVTTTRANDVLVGACCYSSGAANSHASTAPMTEIDELHTATKGLATSDAVTSSAGSYSDDGTLGTSVIWCDAIVAYKVAVPGNIDTGTLVFNLSPAATDVAQLVDTATEPLALTPSYTEAAQRVDAATEALALVASGTDIAAFVDTSTESYKLTPSTVQENIIYAESGIEPLALIPSGTDVYTPGGVVYTDAATEALALIPSVVQEGIVHTDAGTEALAITPSYLEAAQFVDTSTEALALIATGTDVAAYIDAGTESFLLAPSGVDIPPGGADSGTELLALSPSYTETAQRVDTGTELYKLVPSTVQEGIERIDVATEAFKLTASGVEIAQRVDSGIEALLFTPTAVEVSLYVDTTIERVTLTPSGVETLAGQTIDAATELLGLIASGLDVVQFTDTNTEAFKFSPTGVELREIADAITASVVLLPSSTDVASYIDTSIEQLLLAATGTDVLLVTDTGTELLLLNPSAIEVYEHGVDVGVEDFILVPFSTDIVAYVDTLTVLLGLVPSAVEVFETQGFAEVYLKLTPAAVEILKFVILTSAIFKHWNSIMSKPYDTESFFKHFRAKAA